MYPTPYDKSELPLKLYLLVPIDLLNLFSCRALEKNLLNFIPFGYIQSVDATIIVTSGSSSDEYSNNK